MPESIIKPTVGRRLWYWPSPSDRDGAARPAIRTAGDQPCDAGIAYVWSDRCVNLTVADHNGDLHARCSVRLIQEGDAPPGEGEAHAQWMPYQAGQAQKQAFDATIAKETEKSAKFMVGASAAISQRYQEPTQRDRLEMSLVAGIAGNIGDTPSKAGQIADGIKVVLDALHPSGSNSPQGAARIVNEKFAQSHASAVLYPAIKAAMEELGTLHEGFNDAVNRAFNHLHGAFWSEAPAPASAAPLRPTTLGADFLAGSKACDLTTDKPCDACQ